VKADDRLRSLIGRQAASSSTPWATTPGLTSPGQAPVVALASRSAPFRFVSQPLIVATM
jgi:hypothetical protein